MLAALIAPTAGSVEVDGQPVTRRNAHALRSRIGFLTESPGLWERLTVRQNLLTYARLHGLDRPARAVDEVLDVFELRDRAPQRAAHLSKGLKQRVALARTLLHRPDIVLLDEPTAGLDPEMARDVRTLVLRLRDEKHAVLLSTHNLDEVERVADRVAVLKTRLVALDTPGALRARLFGARVRVTMAQRAELFVAALPGFGDVKADGMTLSIAVSDHAAATPAIVRQLVAAGADIQSVVPEEAPLEEVYVRLISEAGQ
jgi:ABC-2 type transport system ATP-binding protein